MKNIKTTTKAITLLILLGFIWGSGYSIARFAMTNGVPALGYAFWQTWGPAIALLIFLFIRKTPLPTNPKNIGFYFITGLVGLAIPNTTIYFSAAHLPAGMLAIIVNTVPIIAYPLALALQEEKFSWVRFIGLIIGITGIMTIVMPKTILASVHLSLWALLTLIAPICFATCAIYSSKFRPTNADSACLSAGMMLFAALILTPIVFSLGQFYPLTPPFTLPKMVVLLEIVLSSTGYIIFFELLKVAGPVYYSLVGGLVGLTGLFWGRVIFKEHLTPLAIISVILILIAIVLISIKMEAYQKDAN